MKLLANAFLVVAGFGAVTGASAQVDLPVRKTLSLDAARTVIAAAVEEAKKGAGTGAIAIVDDGGNLILVERLDGTFAAGANISIGKARTSAMFRKPTKVFEDIIKGGRTPMIALPDFTPLQGGVPIIVDGQVVGAIGVSGAASAQQDEEIAIAGANGLAGGVRDTANGRTSQVMHFDRERVADAFAKGIPLVEGVDAGLFRVNPSRRDEPGDVEVHTAETDIMYVQDGAATLITGGQVVDPQLKSSEEIRAARIEGGETHHLAKGDVIVIPRNVPHWFKEVNAPFVYYVVKVRG